MKDFNLLVDWYVCSCYNTPPKTVLTYISLLETIGNNETDAKSYLTALDNLAYTEVWMQIYSLPRVLCQLNNNNINNDVQKEHIERIINSIYNYLPGKIKNKYKDLAKHYFSKNHSKIIAQIENIILGINYSAREQVKAEDELPYNDIIHNIPQSLLLSIIYSLAAESDFTSEFAIRSENSTIIRKFINNTMMGSYGRYASLLAIHIEKQIYNSLSNDDILKSIKTLSRAAEIEPDLVITYLEYFYNAESESEKEQNIEAILNEYKSLENMDKAFPLNKGADNTYQEYSTRFGAEKHDAEALNALPIIIWQMSLLYLALKCNVKHTAGYIEKYNLWDPYKYINLDTIYIPCKGTKNEKEYRLKRLKMLYKIKNIPGKGHELQIDLKTNNDTLPNYINSIFYSPWLSINKEYFNVKKSFSHGIMKYMGAGSSINLIRLIISSYYAQRIMQELSNDESADNFIRLFMHAADVMSIYRPYLLDLSYETEGRTYPFTVNAKISGLALVMKRQSDLVMNGYYRTCRPERFHNLLIKLANKIDYENSEDYMFNKAILPSVLLSGVYECFSGAYRNNPQSKWVDILPDVYRLFNNYPQYQNKTNELNYALLMRFLCYKKFGPFQYADSWTNGSNWAVQYKKLLISDLLSPGEWVKSKWAEIDPEENPKIIQNYQVRTVQRYIAALKGEDLIDDITKKHWASDWKNYLLSIKNKKSLERFVSLLLVEMLEDSTMMDKMTESDIETIVYTLIEFGNPNNLNRLCSAIFKPNKDKSEKFKHINIRHKLIYALYNYLALKNEKEEKELNAHDPLRYYLNEINKNIVIEDYVNSEIFRIKHEAVTERYIIDELKKTREYYKILSLTAGVYNVAAFSEAHGKTEAENETNLAKMPLACKGALINTKTKNVNVVNDILETKGTNIFEIRGSDRFIRINGYKKNAIYVPAVYLGEEFLSDKYSRLVFSCGLDDYVYLHPKYGGNYKSYSTGDLFTLVIIWNEKKREWNIKEIPEKIKKRKSIGKQELCTAKIKIGRNEFGAYINYAGDSNKIILKEEDYKYWFSDISAVFADISDYNVFCERINDNQYLPVKGTVTDLLLDAPINENMIVLTFVERDICPESGRNGWLFSLKTGMNYFLYQDDFMKEDAEILESVLAGLKDPSGLLVTITVIISENKVCFKLLEKGKCEKIDKYNDISVPFDFRNIVWKYLFYPDELEVSGTEHSTPNKELIEDKIYYAHLNDKENRWYYKHGNSGLPGFPAQINVNWKSPRAAKRKTVEMDILKWKVKNYMSNTVDCLVAETAGIPESERIKYLNAYLNINKFDFVKIKDVFLHNVFYHSGILFGKTLEGLNVSIDSESLTLKAMGQRDHIGAHLYQDNLFYVASLNDKIIIPDRPVVIGKEKINIEEAGNTVRGIVVERPKDPDPDGKDHCKIMWYVITQERITTSLSDIYFDEAIIRKHIKERQGIIAELKNEMWECTFVERKIKVRKLHKLCYSDNITNATYAGRYKDKYVYEKEDGTIIVSQIFRTGATLEGWNITERDSWNNNRIGLAFDNNFIWGKYDVNSKNQYVNILTDIKLSFYKKEYNGETYYDIVRYFEMKYESRIKQVYESKKDLSKENEEEFKKRFEEYIKNVPPAELECKYHDGNGCITINDHNFKVPQTLNNKEYWSNTVAVHEEEGPYLNYQNYSKANARATIIVRKAKYYASFRRHFISLDELIEGYEYNKLIKLSPPLFFVGVESINPETNVGFAEKHYRFESGYGNNYLFPVSRIKYKEKKIESLELVLFPGDAIVSVVLTKNKGDVSFYINITDLSIQYSEPTILYRQRKQKILHLLFLKKIKDDIIINYIEGYSINNEDGKRRFSRSRATLSKRSKDKLKMRFDSNPELNESIVMGRLNDNKYNNEHILEYEHVRLTFKGEDAESIIESEEIIPCSFVKYKKIPNDYNLILAPYHFIDAIDIGEDLNQKIRLIKREFSVRQELLGKLCSEGKYFDTDRILMIKLRYDSVSKQVFGTMIKDMPSRKSEVINSILRGNENRNCLYGTIADCRATTEEGFVYKLELSPGVFVELKESEYKVDDRNKLNKGDKIKVELNDEFNNNDYAKYIISTAFQGDESYFGSAPRPVVALPLAYLYRNNVIEEETIKNNIAKTRDVFTIGDFPDIKAVLAVKWGNSEKTINEYFNAIKSCMVERHPRVLNAVKSDYERSKVVVKHASNIYAGNLDIFDELSVRFVSSTNYNKKINLEWFRLTFSDEPIKVLIERIKNELWQYHDNITADWNEQEGIIIAKQYELLPNSAVSQKYHQDSEIGVLFFEKDVNDNLYLRYRSEDFIKYGLPLGTLIQSIKYRKSHKLLKEYACAGNDSNSRIWLEIMPGRIAQLAPQIAVRMCSGIEISLTSFNWQNISQGDKLHLDLIMDSSVDIERIVVEHIDYSIRSILGENDSVLNVIENDIQAGSLILGAGNYTVQLPYVRQNINADNLVVYNPCNNTLLCDKKYKPKENDTLFLYIKENSFKLLGVEGYDILPERRSVIDLWQNDPLFSQLFNMEDTGAIHWNKKGFNEFIALCGGFMPVTIELVDNINKKIYFSRRCQYNPGFIREGEKSTAQYVGYSQTTRNLILKCGWQYFVLDIKEIVHGFPEKFIHNREAIAVLESLTFWIRKENNTIISGINNDLSEDSEEGNNIEDVFIEYAGVVSDKANNTLGVICRSLKSLNYYWVPQDKITWTEVSPDTVKKFMFENEKRHFKMRLSRDDHTNETYASLIDVEEVKNEFNIMELGRETRATVLEEPCEIKPEEYELLVSSPISGMIFKCVSSHANVQKNSSLSVEIIEKYSDGKISVKGRHGKKIYTLDLPPNYKSINDKYVELLLMSETDINIHSEEFKKANIHSISDEELDKYLYVSYKRDVNSDIALAIALEWFYRSRKRRYVHLGYAIYAINILGYKKDDYYKLAVSLLRQICGRAVRSLHIGILAKYWFNIPDILHEKYDLFQRLEASITILNSQEITSEEKDILLQFINSIRLRRFKELEEVAVAIEAALGMPVDVDYMNKKSPIVCELIGMNRTLPVNDGLLLSSIHFDKLEKILAQVENGLFIILLENIFGQNER